MSDPPASPGSAFSFRGAVKPLFRDLSNSFSTMGVHARADDGGAGSSAATGDRAAAAAPPRAAPPQLAIPSTSILDRDQHVRARRPAAALAHRVHHLLRCRLSNARRGRRRLLTHARRPPPLQLVVGVLLKYVNLAAGWRPRLFVLHDGVLRYYKVPQTAARCSAAAARACGRRAAPRRRQGREKKEKLRAAALFPCSRCMMK
jgi:hypothetical protein